MQSADIHDATWGAAVGGLWRSFRRGARRDGGRGAAGGSRRAAPGRGRAELPRAANRCRRRRGAARRRPPLRPRYHLPSRSGAASPRRRGGASPCAAAGDCDSNPGDPIKIGAIAEVQSIAGAATPAARRSPPTNNAKGGILGRKIEIVTYEQELVGGLLGARVPARRQRRQGLGGDRKLHSEVVLALEPGRPA